METKPEILREELISSQKARMDFLKFKLLAIGVLGAVGLGLEGGEHIPANIDYVLCLIPLVCVYVDFLCHHNTIRIAVIAKFLRTAGDSYECFVSNLCGSIKNTEEEGRHYLFELEDYVLHWTSIVTSFLVLAYGVILGVDKYNGCLCFETEWKPYLVIFFGIIGLGLTWYAKKLYREREKQI